MRALRAPLQGHDRRYCGTRRRPWAGLGICTYGWTEAGAARIARAKALRAPPAGDDLAAHRESREGQEPTLRTTLRSTSRWWILIAAVLLLIGALRAAAVVFLPIG
jgi:hypothetical protein